MAIGSKNTRYQVGCSPNIYVNPQPVIQIKLPGAITTVPTTATGTIANSLNITPALVNTFSTRWGAIFREFLILKVVITVRAVTGSAGTTLLLLDELNATTPTLTSATQQTHAVITNAVGDESSCAILTWKLTEIGDSAWGATASATPVPVVLKIYTDTTLGTTAASGTNLFTVDWLLTFAFRGVI